MSLAFYISNESAVFAIGAFFAGGLLSYWFLRWKTRQFKAALELKEQTILENARREAEVILRETRLTASEEMLQLRRQTEESFANRGKELSAAEHRLHERESLLNRQLENLVREEKSFREEKIELKKRSEAVEELRDQLSLAVRERREQLSHLARMPEAEARALFLKEVEEGSLRDAGHLARRIVDDARTRAEERARQIVSLAIQRYAGEHTFEISTATVALHGDDIKGRIIGREGRNIRAFEAATGVTVLIDDTPNAVVLSGFDPVRREIAREAMERLILDGRIHPTRIEEVVAKVSQEMDDTIFKAGEAAVLKTGIPPLHSEIIKVLGRLRFRQSFSQNILSHSIEVAELAGIMAGELGLDIATAKRAGLLHDIGKAVSHELEGPHAIVGAEFIKRFGEPEIVVNAVAAHHDEVPHASEYGILISAADAISASRPGARSETLTTYIKRVEDLERIGMSFPGVEKCYAVQAGRELRVMVQPDAITDEQAFALSRNIARQIEEALQYPGQIRVTVLRETRCVEFAK
jgi:ribonucrease Y